MVCSHCKENGHNYRGCHLLSREEKDRISNDNKIKKEEAVQRRRERWLQQQRINRQVNSIQMKCKCYEFINDSNYELTVYWCNPISNILKQFYFIPNHSVSKINCNENHRICIFHTLQVVDPHSINNPGRPLPEINMGSEFFQNNTPVFNNIMKDIEGNIIILDKEFKHNKSEIDKWKESSLKANYLLEQIIKLGGKQYDNLEPILDMVEDINIPEHTDYDKELAGIPSKLTNIT